MHRHDVGYPVENCAAHHVVFMINKFLAMFGMSAAYGDKVSGNYRPDIDGMRALAVLPVFIYHMELGILPGGFVGVDIFFVISGYLISGILLRSNEGGSFQFKEFYAKRAKRILPAFYVTVVLTLLAAALIMPPRFFAEAGESAFYAILSLSNIYFWLTSGYFDSDVINKPFLHTWSLSVEEQYYVLWPAIILIIYKLRARAIFPYLAIALTVVSFAAAQAMLRDHAAASFYMLPFRFGELALGAIAAWYRPQLVRLPNIVREITTVIALVMMIGPILVYTSETPFPGLTALIPCLGAFLICGVGASKASGAMFWWRPSIGVGLVSYSMYLLHWPVIVMYHSYFGEMPDWGAGALIFVGVSLGSYLMYLFVEQPFRGEAAARMSHAYVGFLGAMGALVLIVAAAIVWTQDGWPGRYGSNVVELQAINSEQRIARAAALRRECHLQGTDQRHINRLRVETCLAPGQAQPNVLIIGSSYAADDGVVLARAFRRVHWMQMTSPGCVPVPSVEQRTPACRIISEHLGDAFEAGLRPDYVVLSHNWNAASVAQLQDALDYYSQRAGQVVVLGPRGRLRAEVLDIAADVRGDLADFMLDSQHQAADLSEVQAGLAAADWPENASLFQIADFLWDQNRLPLEPVEGRLFFIDDGHFSVEGMEYLARRLRREYQTFEGFARAVGDGPTVGAEPDNEPDNENGEQ